MATQLNEKLIRLIIAQIEETPQHWDQSDWARSSELNPDEEVCKTTFCFAGWTAFMTGMVNGWGVMTAKGRRWQEANGSPFCGNLFDFEAYATQKLGLSIGQASALFGSLAGFDWRQERSTVAALKYRVTAETGIQFP